MSNKSSQLISDDVLEARKRLIETKAAQSGHDLGRWIYQGGSNHAWNTICLNGICEFQSSLSAAETLWIGVSTIPTPCPYIRS